MYVPFCIDCDYLYAKGILERMLNLRKPDVYRVTGSIHFILTAVWEYYSNFTQNLDQGHIPGGQGRLRKNRNWVFILFTKVSPPPKQCPRLSVNVCEGMEQGSRTQIYL